MRIGDRHFPLAQNGVSRAVQIARGGAARSVAPEESLRLQR